MTQLENSMLRLGRILSADYGLQVEVRGKLAYAMKGKIVLPSIRSFSWLGKDAERMLHGLLDHEVGHALFTDFDYIPSDNRAIKALHSAIEDGFVERRMIEKYPGSKYNLGMKNAWFVANEDSRRTLREADVWTAFCLATTMILRNAMTIRDVGELRIEIAAMIASIPDLMKRAALVNSTFEAASVARDIYDHFTEPQPPKEDASKDSEDEESESSDEEQSSGEETSSEDEESESSDEEQSSGEEEERGDDEGGEDGEEDGEAVGASEAEDEDGDAEEAAAFGKELVPAFDPEDFDPDAPLTPEDMFMDMTKEALDGQYVNYSDQPEYAIEYDVSGKRSKESAQRESEQQKAREASYVLAQAFEAALLARREKRLVGGYDEGEVDVALLGQYACGAVSSDELYQQPFAEDDRAVAVSILIDCSGSMRNQKIEVARLTAYAMSMALSTVGIEHEITGFTTTSSSYNEAPFGVPFRERAAVFDRLCRGLRESEARGVPATSFAREVYSRGRSPEDGLLVPVHAIFKSFDESSLDGVSFAEGCAENLDGEAVRWQALRLARRREPRRVMFVLSDGMPAGHRSEHPGNRFLKETIQAVTDAGIEIYGIGILTSAVELFYPRSWVVHNLNDFMTIAMGAMVDTLIEARQEHECVRL